LLAKYFNERDNNYIIYGRNKKFLSKIQENREDNKRHRLDFLFLSDHLSPKEKRAVKKIFHQNKTPKK